MPPKARHIKDSQCKICGLVTTAGGIRNHLKKLHGLPGRLGITYELISVGVQRAELRKAIEIIRPQLGTGEQIQIQPRKNTEYIIVVYENLEGLWVISDSIYEDITKACNSTAHYNAKKVRFFKIDVE